ncbi:MAG: DUF3306 domain-containing protein [Roseovarius sp.]
MSRGADFWSRRRAQVEAEAQAQARASEAVTRAAQEAEVAERTDADLCEDLGLPDPDAMQPGDDFSAFMGHAVPERLRRRALRRLWRSNPVLANVDGLVDYGGDFTDSATVIENLQTAYQVGRGMTAHVEEMACQAEADAQIAERAAEDWAEPGLEEPGTTLATAEDTAPEGAEPDRAGPQTAGPYVWQDADRSGPDADQSPRRRMRFAFEGTATLDETGVSA